jgi:hypothetical protein
MDVTRNSTTKTFYQRLLAKGKLTLVEAHASKD